VNSFIALSLSSVLVPFFIFSRTSSVLGFTKSEATSVNLSNVSPTFPVFVKSPMPSMLDATETVVCPPKCSSLSSSLSVSLGSSSKPTSNC
jgi:hypothetical protein